MREYGKVSPKFWTGETGRDIRARGGDAQRVAMYLLTCPNSNMIGLYYLPIQTICHEVGMTLQGATKALTSLSEAQFAFYDAASEEVFIPQMAAYQVGGPLVGADNRCKGVARELNEYRKSKFYMDFHRLYSEWFHLPLPSPIEAPSKPLASQEQEQEQEQEHEQDQEQDTPLPPKVAFEQFWSAYPSKGKSSRSAAEAAWRKVKPIDFAVVIAAAAEYAACGQVASGYCKHASTWLNGSCWNDDRESWKRNTPSPQPPPSESSAKFNPTSKDIDRGFKPPTPPPSPPRPTPPKAGGTGN